MHTWHHVIFEKAPKKHSTVSYVLLDGPHLATAAASSQFIIRLVLYVEGLATAAFTFGIGIVEGEFAGQFILLPIHDGSNNVEQGHRLDEDVDPVRRHRSVLRRLFKCVIQCVGQSVASSSFDAQPYSQCAFRIVAGEQFLYPFCCPVRLKTVHGIRKRTRKEWVSVSDINNMGNGAHHIRFAQMNK